MTSGVYQLTFPSGATYIGKSINIENRWKQHLDKMMRGTAAKLMQAEWDKYGDFNAQILIECHDDHIDVVESCFINRNRPTLNGTYPKDPYPDMSVEELYTLFETFKMSAAEHVSAISKAKQEASSKSNEVSDLKDTVDELEELNDLLLKKRSQEELIADVSGTIASRDGVIRGLRGNLSELRKEVDSLYKEIECKQKELEYHRRPWWQKIFS